MNQHKASRIFLAAVLVICVALLFCPTSAVATKINIDLSLSIPYFLRMSYSNGICGEMITTKDQIIDKLIPLEYLLRPDAQYESVIAFEIRSNADWQLTITPINIDASSCWMIHENTSDIRNDSINVGNPLSELGKVLQGTPETPAGWHLHVLSPSLSTGDAMPSIRMCVVQPGS